MSTQDLARAVKARRAELGLKQHELTERGGPNPSNVRNIEQAARPTYAATTLSGLDRSLGWVADSAAQLLETGKPPVAAEEDRRKADARAMRIGYAVIALLEGHQS